MSHPRYRSVDAAVLTAQAATRATDPASGLAPSTAQNSVRRWAHIQRWWDAHGITLPVSEQDVLRLLASKEGCGHAYLYALATTIERHYPTELGPAPCGRAVQRFLAGYAREYLTHHTPSDALRPHEYVTIVTAAPDVLSPFVADRLRMGLTLAYAAWLRGSEVVPVYPAHLLQNVNGMIIVLPPFKADREFRKVCLELPPGTGTSVTSELERYGEAARAAGITLGRHRPLLPATDNPSRAISFGTYADNLRAVVTAAGITRHLTTHSARRGGATERAAGPGTIDERVDALMQQGRWQCVESALGYVADAERFDPALQIDYPASSSVRPSSALTSVSNSSASSM